MRFWFRLALAFGIPVEELQERMSSLEFAYWMAYAGEEPFGYEIDNYRAGVIAATVANVAPRKRGAKSLKPSDFYPTTAAKRWTPEQRELMAKQIRKRKRGDSRHR